LGEYIILCFEVTYALLYASKLPKPPKGNSDCTKPHGPCTCHGGQPKSACNLESHPESAWIMGLCLSKVRANSCPAIPKELA